MKKNDEITVPTGLGDGAEKPPDAGEILEEYEQHFAFKLADGYTEQEIARNLGSPFEIAA